jgi:putative membrane-bound dehydrogenase-like protein
LTLSRFDFVAIAPEIPKKSDLNDKLQARSVNEQRWAKYLLDTWQRKGRLPETYPAPIHVLQFGSELTWVWLGGEVVVDYQVRLEKELTDAAQVWVAAYTDDVFAYLASERMRAEGGYEVDSSMIYYNQPGRWQAGTEEIVVARVLDLAKSSRLPQSRRSPEEALLTMKVADGWRIDLLAAEPLVMDPVNIAFDARGRVWVVEMGDYPSGSSEGSRVKILEDRDHDGTLETSQLFLTGLPYANSVYPWRDGAIVCAAPDIFFAADRDGDGSAEYRKTLVTGFAEENPQHRVNGITYGLDHRLYLCIGSSTRTVTNPETGASFQIGGADISLDPDTGDVRREAGKTQFVRSRNDWGDWFGNENSYPMYHYAIEDRYRTAARERGGLKPSERPADFFQHLLNPPTAPPVFPVLRDADRFNDLFAANRFTSACSALVCRSPGAGPGMQGAGLICEPVHNLISRIHIQPQGASWTGRRFQDDENREWLRNDDPWFRPVRVENGLDGGLWVVDMYRQVIEHPQWIPDEWQERLDVRAGQSNGRIYRMVRQDQAARLGIQPGKYRPLNLAGLPPADLIARLSDPSSTIRDLAQQLLIWNANPTLGDGLRNHLRHAPEPVGRLTAYATLRAAKLARDEDLLLLLQDADPRVARAAVILSEESSKSVIPALNQVWQRHGQDAHVAFQLFLTTTFWLHASEASHPDRPAAQRLLGEVLGKYPSDVWFQKAAGLVPDSTVDALVALLLGTQRADTSPTESQRALSIQPLLTSLVTRSTESYKNQLIDQLRAPQTSRPAWHWALARQLADSKGDSLSQSDWGRLSEDAWTATQASSRASAWDGANLIVDFLGTQIGRPADPSGSRMLEFAKSIDHEKTQAHAIGALLKADLSQLDLLLQDFSRWPAETQAMIVSAMGKNQPGQERLAQALESGQLGLRDLPASLLGDLRSPSAGPLRSRFVKLLGPAPGENRQAIVQQYLNQWPSKSHREAGQPLFAKHCAVCHQDRPEGRPLGPSLSDLKAWTNPAWMVAILDPHRAVESKYRRWNVRLESDQLLTGVLSGESAQGITLLQPDGKPIEIARSDIQSMESTPLSLMPEGFEQQLSPREIADLIAYLRSR